MSQISIVSYDESFSKTLGLHRNSVWGLAEQSEAWQPMRVSIPGILASPTCYDGLLEAE